MRAVKNAITSLLLVVSFSITAFTAETRGLSVVAKDTATNQTGEVKLYNKSYAVIIGIDEYPKLSADRQLHYAVNDAKGVESALRKYFRFDRIQSFIYWSSTLSAKDNKVCGIYMADGSLYDDSQSNSNYVWPVRSGK
jgi:uncharacterized caspase-like protein